MVASVKNTNLLMLVYKDVCACSAAKAKPVQPRPLRYDGACEEELHHVDRHRRRPDKCNNYNPQEAEILQCGAAAGLRSSLLVVGVLAALRLLGASLSGRL